MRWLFLLMVILNLSYIAWGITNTAGTKITSLQEGKRRTVPTIRLLSEISKDQHTATASPALANGSVAKIENRATVAIAQNKVNVNNKLLPEVAESVIQKPVTGVSVATKKPASEPVTQGVSVQNEPVQDKSVQGNVVPGGVAKNTLVKPDSTKHRSAQNKANNGKGKALASTCYTSGPFRELKKLHAFTHDIRRYVTKTDVRSHEKKEPSIFWVHLKPLASRVQARRTGRRLRARHIKDFYIIREGPDNNGISLGYFRNKKGAYQLARKVKKMGFKVVVEPKSRSYTIYWLDYQLAEGVNIPKTIFDRYIQSKNNQSKKQGELSQLSQKCNN